LKPDLKLILVFLAGLLAAYLFLPPSNTGDITTYQENEKRYQETFKKKDHEIAVLKGRSETLENTLSNLRHDNDSLTRAKSRVRTVYIQAREATDQNPDSLNLANEVKLGRELIGRQEDHINGLLRYSATQDSLLAVRMEIIQNQDTLLNEWPERFENLRKEKDAQIAKERKKGNRKFWKGFGFGFAARQALEFIP